MLLIMTTRSFYVISCLIYYAIIIDETFKNLKGFRQNKKD